MPCQYPGSTWHPVVIRNASIVNAWLSEIRRTTAKTREDTTTVKVDLPTPRQPYLESGLLPADFTHRARGHITERVNNESNNPS